MDGHVHMGLHRPLSSLFMVALLSMLISSPKFGAFSVSKPCISRTLLAHYVQQSLVQQSLAHYVTLCASSAAPTTTDIALFYATAPNETFAALVPVSSNHCTAYLKQTVFQ